MGGWFQTLPSTASYAIEIPFLPFFFCLQTLYLPCFFSLHTLFPLCRESSYFILFASNSANSDDSASFISLKLVITVSIMSFILPSWPLFLLCCLFSPFGFLPLADMPWELPATETSLEHTELAGVELELSSRELVSVKLSVSKLPSPSNPTLASTSPA